MMRARLLRRAVQVADRPVDTIARMRWTHPRVVVLIYHRVGGRSPSPVDIPRAAFAEQLDLLAEAGRVIDLDRAVGLLTSPPDESEAGTEDRDQSPYVVLTFDDGTADWVDEVLPELVAKAMPATFYVSTDFVENSRSFPDSGEPISWAGLAELASSGLATIGSHTHTHRVLAGSTATVATDEIDRSVGLLHDRLGVDGDHFAYPKAIAPSPEAELVVRRRFRSAVLAGNRVNCIDHTDPHRLGRHGLTVADDAAAFENKVNGGARLEGWLRETRDSAMWDDGVESGAAKRT